MSTEPRQALANSAGGCRVPGRQWPREIHLHVLLVATLLAASCATRMARQLTALCDGRGVAKQVTIVVDSVVPHASPSLQQILGRSADLVLTLTTETGIGRCVDQSGSGSWAGEIPPVFEQATDPDRRLEWRIEEENVVVAFNPRMVDNNLGMALPLRGGTGRWSLSGLAGELASGRAIPEDAGAP